MTSIVDIFPIEVIEHIIDILASDEHYKSGPHEPFQFPTVKACALTCKAFYPRSCYHRFRAIKMYDRETHVEPSKGSVTLDDFERFVKTYPESACRVLELHYSIRGRSYRPEIDDAVPRNLSNLQSLVFSPYRGSMDWAYNVPWHDPQAPEKKQKDALLQILHLPTIVSFKLSRTYNFRPSDLFLCTNLQSLSLQSVSVWPEDDDRFVEKRLIPVSNAASICLRHLEVGGSAINTVSGMMEPVLPEDCPVLDLQDLKELEIKGGLQQEYFISTEKIFKQARQLQYIRVEVGRQTSFENLKFYIPLINASLKTLRSLSIDLYLSGSTDDNDNPDDDNGDEDNFHSLLTTLLSLTVQFSVNKLKSFQVQIRFGPTEIGWRFNEDWITLAQMFLLPKTWPALTHLDLALIVQGNKLDRKIIIKILSDLPNNFLSELSSQDSFKFTFFCGREGEYVPRTIEY